MVSIKGSYKGPDKDVQISLSITQNSYEEGRSRGKKATFMLRFNKHYHSSFVPRQKS